LESSSSGASPVRTALRQAIIEEQGLRQAYIPTLHLLRSFWKDS
jgi:hypothetical protein